MEIKYEAVFGDQSLFDGFMDDCEFTDGNYGFKVANACIAYCERYNQKFGWSPIRCAKQIDVIAMRRIIRTPVWTKADQDAGRLPDVGCEVLFNYYQSAIVRQGVIKYIDDQVVVIQTQDVTRPFCYETCKVKFTPLETPEERAKRLREEWCERANRLISTDTDDRSESAIIYDALLSGELKMPEVKK